MNIFLLVLLAALVALLVIVRGARKNGDTWK